MKKLLIGILFVIATIVGWFLLSLSGSDKGKPSQNKVAVEADVQENSKENALTDNKKAPLKSELNPSKETQDSLSDMESCSNKYESMPEWKEMIAVVEDIYQDGFEAAGNGIFQQMPIVGLRSFAESGDKDAMYHYGVARMWKGAFGVYLNYQAKEESWKDPDGYKNIHRTHKPNVSIFLEGQEYAFQAAVKGRLGGVMEAGYMNQMLASRMNRANFPSDDIINVLAMSASYLELLGHIHKKDPALVASINYENLVQNMISRGFKGKNKTQEQLGEIRNELLSQIEVMLPQLKKRWKDERNVIGLEEFPDLLTPKLESLYYGYIEECLNQG